MDNINNEINTNEYKDIKIETIFLVDWDDTLFPTAFVNKNNINLKNPSDIDNYKLFFIELDKKILELLSKLNSLGAVYIITNASIIWIKNCLNILKKTKKFIMDNKIRIMSARDIYYKLNNSPLKWKILTFQNVIDIIINNNDNRNILNIHSIGDATYEYYGLLNLDDYIKNKYKNKFLLKSIKFLDMPTFEQIIDQLTVLVKNIENISNKINYIDIKFDINK
jgi:hypothetical protein